MFPIEKICLLITTMITALSAVCKRDFAIVLLYFELPSTAAPNTVDQIMLMHIRQYLYKYIKVYEYIYIFDF